MESMYEMLWDNLAKNRKNPETPLRRITYFTQLLAVRVSMFEYTCPDDVDQMWIERYLATTGAILGGERDGSTIITPAPARTGDLNYYGDGIDGIGIPRNGEVDLIGRIGETVAICYNNSSRSPDLDLLYYPEILASIDKSVHEIVEQCRIAPIIGTDNSITGDALTQKLRALRNGEPQIIVAENELKALQKTQSAGVFGVHVVDPDLTHNAQYLAELWDVMLRRFCNMIGIDTRKTTKHAQVSAAEATGLDAVSWILPLDMLRHRQRFCADMQRITGKEWGVKFSEAWQIEWDKYRTDAQLSAADIYNIRAEADKFAAEADAAAAADQSEGEEDQSDDQRED